MHKFDRSGAPQQGGGERLVRVKQGARYSVLSTGLAVYSYLGMSAINKYTTRGFDIYKTIFY